MVAVILTMTGGEALYADMGYFGRLPIRLAWFIIVLPCLLLNYAGQGALLLRNPEAISNPFYMLVPDWALYLMIGVFKLKNWMSVSIGSRCIMVLKINRIFRKYFSKFMHNWGWNLT